MPFDGNGNYILPAPEYPFQAGTVILSADMNSVLSDMQDALSNCLTRDGQGGPLTNFNFNGFRGVNLGTPVDALDAVTRGFVTNGTVVWDRGGFGLTGLPDVPPAGSAAVNQNYVLGLSNNLPLQTGKAGYWLTTNGTLAAWTPVPHFALYAYANLGGF